MAGPSFIAIIALCILALSILLTLGGERLEPHERYNISYAIAILAVLILMVCLLVWILSLKGV